MYDFYSQIQNKVLTYNIDIITLQLWLALFLTFFIIKLEIVSEIKHEHAINKSSLHQRIETAIIIFWYDPDIAARLSLTYDQHFTFIIDQKPVFAVLK